MQALVDDIQGKTLQMQSAFTIKYLALLGDKYSRLARSLNTLWAINTKTLFLRCGFKMLIFLYKFTLWII